MVYYSQESAREWNRIMGAGGWPMRFLIIFTLLLFVGAAHAVEFSEWTDDQAAGKCARDLRRAYGDALSVVSVMGKQPHENDTTLVGLVASDGRTGYKGQQVVVGCIYKQDASLFTIFFNSKIANWPTPERTMAPSKQVEAPAKRPSPPNSHTIKTYTPAELRSMVESGNYPKQGAPKVETHDVNFVECVVRVEAIIVAVKPNYQTATIVSTHIMHLSKAWTNDAAMTFTCSAAENKLIITTAPYL